MNTDPTRDEILSAIPQIYKGEDGFADSFEVALYYLASHYHGGQGSYLYGILSTSPYTPGRMERDVEPGTMEKYLYDEMVTHFFPKSKE